MREKRDDPAKEPHTDGKKKKFIGLSVPSRGIQIPLTDYVFFSSQFIYSFFYKKN